MFIQCSKTAQNGVKTTLETLGSYSSQLKLECTILSQDQVLSSYIRISWVSVETSGLKSLAHLFSRSLSAHTHPSLGSNVRTGQFTQRQVVKKGFPHKRLRTKRYKTNSKNIFIDKHMRHEKDEMLSCSPARVTVTNINNGVFLQP